MSFPHGTAIVLAASILGAGTAVAEDRDGWKLDLGAGYASLGTIKMPGAGATSRLGSVEGPSYSLAVQRDVYRRGDWSLRAGGELDYVSGHAGTVTSNGVTGGSGKVDEISGFAVLAAARDFSAVTPYAGLGLGVAHDHASVDTPNGGADRSATYAAGKAFVGTEWKVGGASFGVRAGTTFSLDGHRF